MGNLCAGQTEQPVAEPTKTLQPPPPALKTLPYVDPKKHPHVLDPNGQRPPSPTEVEGRSHSYHKACGADSEQKQLSVAQIDELMGLAPAKDQPVADDVVEGDTVTVDIVTADDIHKNEDEEDELPPPPDAVIEEEPRPTEVPTEDELASFPPPSPVVLDGHHDFDDGNVSGVVVSSDVVDDTMIPIHEEAEIPPVVSPTEPDHVVVEDDESNVPPPMSPTHPEPDVELDTVVDPHNEDHDEPEPLYQHEVTPPVSDNEELEETTDTNDITSTSPTSVSLEETEAKRKQLKSELVKKEQAELEELENLAEESDSD
eukprot:m.134442 g.134442  ORF g.134442 m.134442 type:complete len:315 (-) comp29739_c4_seq1:85-1029(-)